MLNLIDHLFVYDNFPEMDFSSIKEYTGFQVSDFKLEERTEYPLTLEVSKTDRLRIRFNFDSSKYSAESIERLSELYKNICLSAVQAQYPRDIKNISEKFERKLKEDMQAVAPGRPSDYDAVDSPTVYGRSLCGSHLGSQRPGTAGGQHPPT